VGLTADAGEYADTVSDEYHIAELFEAASAVKMQAHVPYSGFPVGAALLDETGRIHAGCNVENASYPEGICAEANAIGAMVAAGARSIVELLTVSDGDLITTCCGGCRQKIREFAGADAAIHAAGPEGVRRSYTLTELLPDSFGPDHLA